MRHIRYNWWRSKSMNFRPLRQGKYVKDGRIFTEKATSEPQPPKYTFWDTTQPNTKEFTNFINTNYEADTIYPQSYIDWLLNYPNTIFIIVRSKLEPHQIEATAILRPLTINIRRRKIKCHYGDMFCIRKTLRRKGIKEKMFDKTRYELSKNVASANDICIYLIDKKPLPYQYVTSSTNYLFKAPAQQSQANPYHRTPSYYDIKTYNGEPQLTSLLLETTVGKASQLPTPPSTTLFSITNTTFTSSLSPELYQEFTEQEFQYYYTTDMEFRISYYRLQPNSPPQFCCCYFLDTKDGKIAGIVKFFGTDEFLLQIVNKLISLNIKYINALESAYLPAVDLISAGFQKSEKTFTHMHNYQTKSQIATKNVDFTQP